MKANELRKLSTEELVAKEKELKEELFNLRFQLATGQLSNPQRIGECKKDVARVKTLLCERELKAERRLNQWNRYQEVIARPASAKS